LFDIQLAELLPILAHMEQTAQNDGFMTAQQSWVESGSGLRRHQAGQ